MNDSKSKKYLSLGSQKFMNEYLNISSDGFNFPKVVTNDA